MKSEDDQLYLTERELLSHSYKPAEIQVVLTDRYTSDGQTYLPVVAPPKPAAKSTKKMRKQATFRFANKVREGLREFINQNRPESELKYSDFDEFRRIWTSYIEELLFADTDSPSSMACLTKLATADFHGSVLEVVEAKNPSTVGLAGVVLWEGRSVFVVITARDKIKIVEKRGTIFQIVVRDQKYHLLGSRLLYRTSERSGRKFKTHGVADL